MFNQNNIKDLWRHCEDHDNKIRKLQDEIWKLKNPAKFKIGDRVSFQDVDCVTYKGKGSIVFVEYRDMMFPHWQYTIFDGCKNHLFAVDSITLIKSKK